MCVLQVQCGVCMHIYQASLLLWVGLCILHYFIPSKSHYAQFYSFYAASITIPYYNLNKLPIKVSYLMLVEPLKVLILLPLMSVLNPE